MQKKHFEFYSTVVIFSLALSANIFCSSMVFAEPLQLRHHRNPFAGLDEKKLDQLISKLKNPAGRVDALPQVIELAAMNVYHAENKINSLPERERRLAAQAYKALVPYMHDSKTLAMCLLSSDETLHDFAYRVAAQKNGTGPAKAPVDLLPTLRKVAVTDTQDHRKEALKLLKQYPSEKGFIDKCMMNDPSPWVFSPFIENDGLFNRRLNEVLRSRDEKVRVEALNFISSNSGNTETTFYHPFDQRIIEALIDLRNSKSIKERKMVAAALPALNQIDPNAVKSVLGALSKDPSEEVNQYASISLQELTDLKSKQVPTQGRSNQTSLSAEDKQAVAEAKTRRDLRQKQMRIN